MSCNGNYHIFCGIWSVDCLRHNLKKCWMVLVLHWLLHQVLLHLILHHLEISPFLVTSHQLGLDVITLHLIILMICIGERTFGKGGEIANFVCQNLLKMSAFPPFVIACWMKWTWLRGIDKPLIFDIANIIDFFIVSDSSLRVWHWGDCWWIRSFAANSSGRLVFLLDSGYN